MIALIVDRLSRVRNGEISVRVPDPEADSGWRELVEAVNDFLGFVQKSSEECREMKDSLRESEERFRSLFDNSTLGIYRTTPAGQIILVNPTALRMLGYNSFEDLSIRNLEQSGFEPAYPRDEFKRRLDEEGTIIGLESAWIRKDGSVMFVRESARAIRDESGTILYYDGIFEDITQRKEAQIQIEKDLSEKVLLLKEVHHRVKNNLQIICSLLNLQSLRLQDEEAKTAFQYSKSRIYSMALVHEQLYRSGDFSKIQMKPYVDMLLRELDKAYQISSRIRITSRIDDSILGIDDAIPCGLILNELLTNAVKHAFPGNRRGEIAITVEKKADQTHEIVVRDNGVGMPESVDMDRLDSLGLHMVKVLVNQIDGDLFIEEGPGTAIRIRF
ncbi:PAS domain S-box protein [bacterium]|nr:PAS domain S-box protein [bacterium]